MVDCNCGKKYVGETKLKISTRLEQHKKSIEKEKWDSSGISYHAEDFKWDRVPAPTGNLHQLTDNVE